MLKTFNFCSELRHRSRQASFGHPVLFHPVEVPLRACQEAPSLLRHPRHGGLSLRPLGSVSQQGGSGKLL